MGRFPAVIDRRYRNGLILPRGLFAKWPEEGADGEEDGLDEKINERADFPENLVNYDFHGASKRFCY